MPTLSASIEKNTAKIGDLLWVTLQYALPENAKLPESGGVGGLETLTIIEYKTEPNQIKIRFLVDQLESFGLGPFSLTYIDHQNNEQQVTTNPITITISSNLGEKIEDATLKPIEDIISTQSRWLPYLLWAFGTIILLGLVSGFIWWRKKRRIHDIQAAMEDPPHVKADKEIDNLIASGLFERGDVKAFYFIFSETIRRYMESIRCFPAAEMTTEEIAKKIKTDPSDQHILPLLRQADLVKFADLMPAPDRKDQDILMARTYIQQTRPMTNGLQESPSLQEVQS
ncbi:hypothetical protein ACFL2E_06640 [Thermodesulfobacteriota bacterium]